MGTAVCGVACYCSEIDSSFAFFSVGSFVFRCLRCCLLCDCGGWCGSRSDHGSIFRVQLLVGFWAVSYVGHDDLCFYCGYDGIFFLSVCHLFGTIFCDVWKYPSQTYSPGSLRWRCYGACRSICDDSTLSQKLSMISAILFRKYPYFIFIHYFHLTAFLDCTESPIPSNKFNRSYLVHSSSLMNLIYQGPKVPEHWSPMILKLACI